VPKRLHPRPCCLLLAAGAFPALQVQAGSTTPPHRIGAETPAPASASIVPTENAQAVTLDEAVRTALRRNPSLEEAIAAVRRSEGAVAEARALRMPRLDVAQRFTVQGPIPSFSFAPAPGQPPQEVKFGQEFTRNLNVTGSYDTDAFGRLRARREAAQHGVNVTRGAYYLAQNELVFAVQNVFFAALRSRELIKVAQSTLDASREQLRVAEAQFRAGTVPEFDVLRARVQEANNRQSLVSAEAAYRRTRQSLARLLAMEGDALPDPAPVALPPEPDAVASMAAREAMDAARRDAPGPPARTEPELPPLTAPLPSLEVALNEAFQRRPEVYRAAWAERVAQARVKIERKGNVPSLSFQAGFAFNPDQAGFAFETKTYSLVANVMIPLWDGGVTKSRTSQAREDVRAAQAQLRAARLEVTEEVRRSLTDLQDAAERRRAASANTSQAVEALRIARVRYNAGLAQNVEVIDSQAALTLARTNEVNAAYDYLIALAALNRSLGRYASAVIAPVPLESGSARRPDRRNASGSR
jgi:outer membrane protein TolC